MSTKLGAFPFDNRSLRIDLRLDQLNQQRLGTEAEGKDDKVELA
jgi:hypothetical protein